MGSSGLNHVWVFEWKNDPYESDWRLISIHRTAKSCFKRMSKTANELWYQERLLDLQFGKSIYWPLSGQKWRIRKIFLEN